MPSLTASHTLKLNRPDAANAFDLATSREFASAVAPIYVATDSGGLAADLNGRPTDKL